MSWETGQEIVDQMISTEHVRRLNGADAGVPGLMERANSMLKSAEKLIPTDPVTAYMVAYDAAKHAAMALLAEQNLRAVGPHPHKSMEDVLKAQFGGTFNSFSRLRRRRNELDYPSPEEEFSGDKEATDAHATASQIVSDAQKLLDRGVLTTF